MKTTKNNIALTTKPYFKRPIFISLSLIIIAVIGVVGYFYLSKQSIQQEKSNEDIFSTNTDKLSFEVNQVIFYGSLIRSDRLINSGNLAEHVKAMKEHDALVLGTITDLKKNSPTKYKQISTSLDDISNEAFNYSLDAEDFSVGSSNISVDKLNTLGNDLKNKVVVFVNQVKQLKNK